MSGGRAPRGGPPLPEGVQADYPPSAKTNARCGGRLRVIPTVQDAPGVQALLARQARSGAPARRTAPPHLTPPHPCSPRLSSTLDAAPDSRRACGWRRWTPGRTGPTSSSAGWSRSSSSMRGAVARSSWRPVCPPLPPPPPRTRAERTPPPAPAVAQRVGLALPTRGQSPASGSTRKGGHSPAPAQALHGAVGGAHGRTKGCGIGSWAASVR